MSARKAIGKLGAAGIILLLAGMALMCLPVLGSLAEPGEGRIALVSFQGLVAIVMMGMGLLGVATIPANIAEAKGRDWTRYFVFGVLLFPYALLQAVSLGPDGQGNGTAWVPWLVVPVILGIAWGMLR